MANIFPFSLTTCATGESPCATTKTQCNQKNKQKNTLGEVTSIHIKILTDTNRESITVITVLLNKQRIHKWRTQYNFQTVGTSSMGSL